MESEMMTDAEDIWPYPFGSVRDLLTALFRQKIKVLLVFIVASLGVGIWVYFSETLYDAHTTLVLKFGREHIFRPEVGAVDQIVQFNEKAAVESEREIIGSRDLVRRVVQTIGPEALYPDVIDSSKIDQTKAIEIATSIFLGKLESDSTDGTNLIEITFFHEQPEMAAQALNLLVEFLKERHLQVFSDPKSSFLSQRLSDYQKELEDSERALQRFKQQHDLSSPIDDQQRRLMDQRAHLDTSHKAINHKRQGLIGKIASLENQIQSVPEQIPLSTTEAGGIVAKAKSDLFALKRREQGLLQRYTELSSPVQNIKKEIELVEEFIAAQSNREGDKSVTSGKNPVFHQLEVARLTALAELDTLQASDQVIVKQIQDLDVKIQRLDTLREKLVGLERTKSAAEDNYKLYVKKVEEAKVSEELDKLKMSNISVIQTAEIPRKPAGRPKYILLILGMMLSSMLSIGLAVVFEYLKGDYVRPEQAAEDLGLPILASFSHRG